jgi:hypothetical protein
MKLHLHNILGWGGSAVTGVVQYIHGNYALLFVTSHDWVHLAYLSGNAGMTAAIGWLVTRLLDKIVRYTKNSRQ